jgi:aldehyde:ferredoxin oxidoreductase
LEDLERIGERIYNLERAFNCREGLTRRDDDLPYRVKFEGIPSGPSEGMCCPPEELERMLQEYYRLRGWKEEGVPSDEKLRELGLDFVIGQI